MTIADVDFEFDTGAAENEAAEEASRPNFSRTRAEILRFNDETPTHLVRFLDDDRNGPSDRRPNLWKGVAIHGYIATVPKPKEFEGKKWPPGMMAVCRYAKAFKGHFKNCIVCDEGLKSPDGREGKPSQKMYARVVVRERVNWNGDEPEFIEGTPEFETHDKEWRDKKKGTLRGYRDKTETVKEIGADGKTTGHEIEVPMIRLVEQSRYLFFQQLVDYAQGQLDEGEKYTVLDRDFRITKSGKERKTQYNITELRHSEKMKGSTETVVIDGETVSLKGVRWDVNNPQVLAYYEQFLFWTISGYLKDRVSDEHHERWFVPGGYAKHKGSNSENAEGDDAAEDKPAAKKGPQPASDDDFDEDDAEDTARARNGAPSKAEEDQEKAESAAPSEGRMNGWREKIGAGERQATERTDSSGVADEIDDDDFTDA